ncbi:uncharacterized protein PHALS_02377 [Plasmopara halstedii]|uniref:Uncharacterized protein n=1 Tax=Plasmopara halstedii TaxID=4781 RepID=A0A0P1AZ12_PLAHL|nr:uncharacterized protein PHALS_02377 [Plasmopara halstedii]CEG46054.1 hypothetical protein PHALS_02377 [Plasmopara halstedii]|eukprot:XP_024582423.1 hypothetical protein PHALS_02377 [Plasmopara halstedii]
MNGYLRSKCSSEQQLLNEFAKLLETKEVASRKMADLLRALTFFFTSAARGSRLPFSLLSGLCVLLPQLKDKREYLLLKDEQQRIARITICLLSRLIDQLEIETTNRKNLQQLNWDQSAEPVEQLLHDFMLLLEATVMNPCGLLMPRQRATMRLYAQLCRNFNKRQQLTTYITTLLQQSPVLALDDVSAGGKGKRSLPLTHAHFGAIAGACHALRFHTTPDEQITVVNSLVQLAFMLPASIAARHAAKTLLSLLTSSLLSEDRTPQAVTVAESIEAYLLKARPRTLLGGDSLTSVYLLRLCGLLFRSSLSQSQHSQNSAGVNSDVLNHDLASLATSPGKTAQQVTNFRSFLVSEAMKTQFRDYFIGSIQESMTSRRSDDTDVSPTVLLIAVEEILLGTSPEDCYKKQPSAASKNIFDLVTAVLLSLLPAQKDLSRLTRKSVTLHRVCRAVQFVAERMDAAVLQINKSSDQKIECDIFSNQLISCIHLLTKYGNDFVACEAFRAFVWLLPRCNSSCDERSDINDWETLFLQLNSLPFHRIQPERRAAIAWTLFRRCVTTPIQYEYKIEALHLLGCLRMVLAWFRARPCVWHAAMLTAIWQTALCDDFLEQLGNDVFLSINELLDYQRLPSDNAAADCLVVKQSTLQFLNQRDVCLRFAVRKEAWHRPLIMRLMKQICLETSTSQRLGIQALSNLCVEAKVQKLDSLADQVNCILSMDTLKNDLKGKQPRLIAEVSK